MGSDLNDYYLSVVEAKQKIDYFINSGCEVEFCHSQDGDLFYRIYDIEKGDAIGCDYIRFDLSFNILRKIYENPERLFKNIIQFNIDETYEDTHICEILGVFKGSCEIESMEVSLIESLMFSGFNFQQNKYSTHTCVVWETDKGLVFEVDDERS